MISVVVQLSPRWTPRTGACRFCLGTPRLLLDEHISPDVADGLQRRQRSLIIHRMAEWEGGSFLGKNDSACLLEAAEQGLTLVTYDRRTIPPLLKIWAEEGRRPSHYA